MTKSHQIVELHLLLSFQIAQLNTQLSNQERAVLAQHGALSPAQWRILRVLGEGAADTTTAVRKMAAIDKGQFSKTINNLVGDGYVLLSAYAKDKRQMVIGLTKKGSHAFDTITPDLDARNEHLLAALNEIERSTIYSAIEALSKASERTEFSTANAGHSKKRE